jgi:hypothetical protein
MKSIQLGPLDRAGLCPRTEETKRQKLALLGPMTKSSLRNDAFKIKDNMMDDVKNCDSYIHA